MELSGGNQDKTLQNWLIAAKSPIGIVVIIIVVAAQAWDTVITIVSSKEGGLNLILPIFGAMLGFMLIIYSISAINDTRIRRRQVQQNEVQIRSELQTQIAVSEEEKKNLKRVIRQKNKDIRELKEQLEERKN